MHKKTKVNKRNKRGPHDPYPHPTTVVRGSPLASATRVKIPVSWNVTLAQGGANFVTTSYKINSLADAGIVYVGLNGFNTLYTKYRVLGASLHLDFLGSSATTHAVLSVSASPVSTAIASASDVLASAVMPNSVGATCGLSSGSSIERRQLSFQMVKVAGTDEVYTSDSYAAATSAVADPADLIYLHVSRRIPSGGTDSTTSNVIVRGHLDVQYFERKTIV